MDCYSYYFLFPKCKTHAYTRFENGCSENSTQKLLTKYSTEEKIASGRTEDLWHSFFPIRTSRPANNIYRMYFCHFDGQFNGTSVTCCVYCFFYLLCCVKTTLKRLFPTKHPKINIWAGINKTS